MNDVNPTIAEVGAKQFVRTAHAVKETKGTFKFDEDVQNDMPVFRSIYIEKWTQVRGHSKIEVTVKFL